MIFLALSQYSKVKKNFNNFCFRQKIIILFNFSVKPGACAIKPNRCVMYGECTNYLVS